MSSATTQIVTGPFRHEGDPIKGSRFIVDVAPVADECAARELLRSVRSEFADASHHCSAWRIARPAIERSSDDGEPGGSAGRPILAQLTGRDLVDTAVIVTRYFGGTKLGVGGLMRGYGGAAGIALDQMTLEPWVEMTELTFTTEYALTDTVERLVTQAEGLVVNRTFDADVAHHVRLPVSAVSGFAASIADATAGAVAVCPD